MDEPLNTGPKPALATPAATALQCPRCASRDVHRSRTRAWERPLRFFFPTMQPYRCYACRWRGWRRVKDDAHGTLVESES